jgi:hypothetical protein
VTNTGNTVITGKVAVYTIKSMTGFPPGTVTAGIELATPAAEQAQIDETAAYTYCKS